MRTRFSSFALAASIALALAFTLSCGNHSLEDWFQEDTSSSSSAKRYSSSSLDIFAVDISQETEEWNYMVVAKDGSSMFIDVDESNDMPTRMFIKPDKNSDKGFSLFFKEDGLPDKMVADGNILYFGNFNGYKYDLAIIYPDNKIEYHYGIETDVDWDAYRVAPKAMLVLLKSNPFSKLFNKIMSIAVPAVTCAAAVVVHPLADACASSVVKLVANTAVETVFDGSTKEAGKALVDVMLCANGSIGSCVSALYSSISLRSKMDFNLITKKTTQINEVIKKLNGGGKSSSSGSISSSSSIQSGIITGSSVDYEGETYETVVIGNQTWFKRNLNYKVSGSKCGTDDGKLSDEDTDICAKYGRLYNWGTAIALPDCNINSCASNAKRRGICPNGWHIPSEDEWFALEEYIGRDKGCGYSCVAKHLKSTSGWSSESNGLDSYGFSAMPGGYGDSGDFKYVGDYGYWWTATEDYRQNADLRLIYNESVVKRSLSKSFLYSVRCIQD